MKHFYRQSSCFYRWFCLLMCLRGWLLDFWVQLFVVFLSIIVRLVLLVLFILTFRGILLCICSWVQRLLGGVNFFIFKGPNGPFYSILCRVQLSTSSSWLRFTSGPAILPYVVFPMTYFFYHQEKVSLFLTTFIAIFSIHLSVSIPIFSFSWPFPAIFREDQTIFSKWFFSDQPIFFSDFLVEVPNTQPLL